MCNAQDSFDPDNAFDGFDDGFDDDDFDEIDGINEDTYDYAYFDETDED